MNQNWNINFNVAWTWIIAIGMLLGWVAFLAAWFMELFFDRLEGLL